DLQSITKFMVPRPGRRVEVRRTSGSTGTPYKVLIDSDAAAMETALFYRFLFAAGYTWGDRIIKVWGAPVAPSTSLSGMLRATMRSVVERRLWNIRSFDTYRLDEGTIAEIISLMCDDTPQIIRGYTSSIYAIAQEVNRCGIKINVKAVTTTAEKLFDYQRRTIEKAFGQAMYDQYGCGESNSIAFECEK